MVLCYISRSTLVFLAKGKHSYDRWLRVTTVYDNAVYGNWYEYVQGYLLWHNSYFVDITLLSRYR